MKHLKRNIVILGAACLIFSACGGNSSWKDHEPANLTEKIAFEACKCVYKLMEADERFDVEKILAELEAHPLTEEEIRNGELLRKMPETTKALMAEEELSLKLDGSKCMKPINEKAFDSGIDFEVWMVELDAYCKLGIFYN